MWRLVQILWVFIATSSQYLFRRARLGFASRQDVLALRGELLAGAFEGLGAAFIKLGQMMSSRPDVYNDAFIAPFFRLQDAVTPMPIATVRAVLDTEFRDRASMVASIEETPVASASVAQVHRARLMSGEVIALKIQRPRAFKQIHGDLALLALVAKLLNLVPSLRLLSLPGTVEELKIALSAQLDFEREAENNRRFASNLKDVDGVRVPALYSALCTPRVLAMEFIEGLPPTDDELFGLDRQMLARRGILMVLQAMFVDGFVHADLHPGNVLITPDGDIVMIDLGLVAEIPGEWLRPWLDTFIAVATNDGARAAWVYYSYAPDVRNADYASFEKDIVELFSKYEGMSLAELEVGEVLNGIFAATQRHGITSDPALTVANLALVVAEGLGKQLDPDLDLFSFAVPHFLKAYQLAPEAEAPPRPPPRPHLPPPVSL